MSLRHFSTDTAMAIRRYWQDEPDGGVTIVTEHDVQDIVDHAKMLHGQYSQHARWAGDGFHQVASMPITTMLEFHKEGRMQDQKAIRKWLNDSSNAVFRTRPGRI